MHVLKYEEAAQFWEEALPLGNGCLGAMFYGDIGEERIDLNEDTLWSGRPSEETGYRVREMLESVRGVIREGRYAEAMHLTDEMTGLHDTQSYQMAGTLRINFAGEGDVKQYHRRLDLNDAMGSVEFERGGVGYRRECFVSHPHQMLAFRVRSETSAMLHCTLTMDSPLRGNCEASDQSLTLRGQCPLTNHSRGVDDIVWEADGVGGMRYVVRARVLTVGGTVAAGNGELSVRDADEVLVLVAIKTGFNGFDQAPSDDIAAMEVACDHVLDTAAAAGWNGLVDAHTEDYQTLYNRVQLDLGAVDERPTDEILKGCTDPADATALINLVFNYGRYLLISCSRPGTQAATLQGIWNDKLVAPWRCNYTTNINLEMNYWPAESCNLADCAEPMLRFVREVALSGKRPAQQLYKVRGWCLHHNSDLWRYSYTGGASAQHAFWPVGGAWICQHLWEHYVFSGNCEFLATALPLMKEAAAFLLDFMVENSRGEWVTSPSTSPENRFFEPGTEVSASVCEGSAMDMTMIRELFGNIIEGSSVLGETDALVAEVEAAYDCLAMPVIGEDGRLLEFGIEAREPEPNHRHVSHLYGVYPGWMFTPDQHADLYEACRKSLDARGDKSTGWAMGWRVALWARFRDGDRALRVIGNLLTYVDADSEMNYSGGGGLYANLWDAHPPFQIDGNFGVTAGIAEMLVQSHRVEAGTRVIDLLPALPGAWQQGAVSGLRGRDGTEIGVHWNKGELTQYQVRATVPVEVAVRCGHYCKHISLKAGEFIDERLSI